MLCRTPTQMKRNTLILLTGFLCLTAFGVLATRFYEHTVDDAFISYRYARNLAAGHGLVYNPGERVEGYTNFLWTVLISGALRLGWDAEFAGRALGVLSSLGLLATILWYVAKTVESPAALWVAPVFLAISPGLAVWATGGLETPLFALLVTLGVCMAAIDAE